MERRVALGGRVHGHGWLAAVVLLGVAACGQAESSGSPRQLAEGLLLGPEWTEIEAYPPLVVQRSVEELVLHHSTELTLTRAHSAARNTVYCPMLGATIRLDVELETSDGGIESLGSSGISPGRLGMRPLDERLPSEFSVTRLRLRAHPPLGVTKLEWRPRREPMAHANAR